MNKAITFLLFFLLAFQSLFAQQTRTLTGSVHNEDGETLIGVNILVKTQDQMIGATTDVEGKFKIAKVPVGRHDIAVTYIGYEPANLDAVLLTSGKELFLNIELTESTLDLETVVVTAKYDKTKTLNEMATVSARSFSVEETSRYAAAFYDAQPNYIAAVTGTNGKTSVAYFAQQIWNNVGKSI